MEEANTVLREERDGLAAAHARIARDASELQARRLCKYTRTRDIVKII